MPLFHDLSSLDKLKIEIKHWERSFFKINGRKPKRPDIDRAGKDVIDMYRKFWSAVRKSKKDGDSKDSQEKDSNGLENQKSQQTNSHKTDKDNGASSEIDNTFGRAWNGDLLKKKTSKEDTKKSETAPNPVVNNLLKVTDKRNFKTTLKRRKKPVEQTTVPETTEATCDLGTVTESTTNMSLTEQVTVRYEGNQASNGESDPRLSISTPLVMGSEGDNAMDMPPRTVDDVDSDNDIEKEPNDTIFSSILSFNATVVSSSCESFKENISLSFNTNTNMSSSSNNEAPLFSDNEEEDLDARFRKVKEKISSEIKEFVEFEGCHLLPLNFKPKKKKTSPPTAKEMRRKNDNAYVKVNLKKKSFASKGYRKVNVSKMKKRNHRQLKRNRCFSCGEQGHWAQDCPMRTGGAKNKTTAVDDLLTAEEKNLGLTHEDIPFLSADCVVSDAYDDFERRQEDDMVEEGTYREAQLFDEQELEREHLFY